MIDVLWSKSKFLFFDHVESENRPYFAETENGYSKFLYAVKYVKIYQKRHKKLEKSVGQIDSFLPWTQI